MEAIIIILGVLIGLAIICGICGLIFWGIGSFIIWAFGLGIVWTFWHGLAVAFIVSILKGIFGGHKSDK